MSYNLATGKSAYPYSYAQLGEVGLLCNGVDDNQILDLRTGQLKTLGMAAPTAAPTGASTAGTDLTGTFLWRVRWADQSTGTVSLPSATYQASPNGQRWRITAPGSPDSRATHWILERTTNGGGVFYPVNTSDASPWGTAIATTTYDDTTSDSTLRNRDGEAFDDVQGQPSNYLTCWANGATLFMAGGAVHEFSGSITNGTAALTGTGFTADMVGWDVSFDDDVDGKTYRISAFTNSTSVTLAENYTGTTKSTDPARASPPTRDEEAWCEPNEAESWGGDLIGGLSNRVRFGDDGEPITAGVGLGPAGCLVAKETRLYLHSYRLNPQLAPIGDGRIVALQSLRGACGKECLRRVNDRIFGMDTQGVWYIDSPGAEPVDITGPILTDWRALDFSNRRRFHIRYDLTRMEVYFWVIDASTDDYPKIAYIWDLRRMAWVGTKSSRHAGVTCGAELPDSRRAPRTSYFTEVVGSASSYLWFDNIGTSLGAGTSATPLVGTASAGSSTTVTVTSGAFPTTGEKLKGVPCTIVRAADGSSETKLITDNTATVLTVNAWAGTAPVSGDTVIVGPISCGWKTGRIACGDSTRKKLFRRVYVWLKADADAHDLNVRVYLDGSTTAFSDRQASLDEDGVDIDASTAAVGIDPADQEHRYYVPVGKWGVDIQLEFYGVKSGVAWEILGVDLEYKWDRAEDPRKTA